jgi:hypothetical protein
MADAREVHMLPVDISKLISRAFEQALDEAGIGRDALDPEGELFLTQENCGPEALVRINAYFAEQFGESCTWVSMGYCGQDPCWLDDGRPTTWDPAGCGPRCLSCH